MIRPAVVQNGKACVYTLKIVRNVAISINKITTYKSFFFMHVFNL